MRAMEFLWMTLSQLYVGAFLLRFLLQLVRADFYNPLSQFIVRITSPLLRPLRRIVPGWRGIDFSTLLVVVVLEAVAIVVWFLIMGVQPAPATVAMITFVKLIDLVLNIYFFALIAHALMSWVAQGYHPVMAVLGDLTAPILNPLRRVLPSAGGIDFSPMVAILGIMFIRLLLGDIFPGLRGLI